VSHTHETDSEFLRHEPCPNCGSDDNLARYSDGHGFCFGCGHYEHPKKEATVEETEETPRKRNKKALVQGEVRALAKRCITEETCQKWRYHFGTFNGKPVQIANYCDEHGAIVAQKLRFANKDFLFQGEPKKAGLYGQWLWRDNGKMVVITEGEIDALSVSQLQGNKWPVVSVPNGAQGAAKSIAKSIEWLEHFEKVVFLFDDDEPGREAAQECATLLTPGRAFIGRIDGYKDANEALQAGAGAKVIDAIWGAKAYRPDGVVMIEELFEHAFEPVVTGLPWPWECLTEKTYGIRLKEMYAFGGGVGCGKSDVFNEIAVHLIQHGHKVGMLKFEEPPNHSTRLLAGKYLSKRLHVPGIEMTPEERDAVTKALNGNVAMFDHFGAMDYDTVKERIRYMVVSLGIQHIFLDHLTALAASLDGDERRGIDKMMADLSALTQQLNFTLYFVSHLTTPEGKPHEEGGRVLEKHFRGSRSIAQWSHYMFGIERNKQDPSSPTTFRVLKDRYTGDANGLTFGLRYDRDTGRLHPCELPVEGEEHGFDKPETDGEF
jgi:twinkle protein